MLFLTKISSRIIHEMVLTIGSCAYLENMGGYNRKRWRWYFYTKHRDVVGITFSLEVAISFYNMTNNVSPAYYFSLNTSLNSLYVDMTELVQ
jgi:hypothetical protein